MVYVLNVFSWLGGCVGGRRERGFQILQIGNISMASLHYVLNNNLLIFLLNAVLL